MVLSICWLKCFLSCLATCAFFVRQLDGVVIFVNKINSIWSQCNRTAVHEKCVHLNWKYSRNLWPVSTPDHVNQWKTFFCFSTGCFYNLFCCSYQFTQWFPSNRLMFDNLLNNRRFSSTFDIMCSWNHFNLTNYVG